jgi:hypothetical protein
VKIRLDCGYSTQEEYLLRVPNPYDEADTLIGPVGAVIIEGVGLEGVGRRPLPSAWEHHTPTADTRLT